MTRVRVMFVCGLACALLARAGVRQELWRLNLSDFANHDPELAAKVWGIRFSPDDKQVAIGFGPRWNFDSRLSHVVVLDVERPESTRRMFDVAAGSPFPSAKSIVWSPSGAILVARTVPPAMFRLGNEPPCRLPGESEFGGFLSGDQMVVVFRYRAEIRIISTDCSTTDSWVTEAPTDVLDTSPEANLIAMKTSEKNPGKSTIKLVGASDHEVKRSWIWDPMATFHGGFLFCNQGRQVCTANMREGSWVPDVACWDTKTGAQIAENTKVAVDWGGISGSGELLALTDYKYLSHEGRIWQFFDLQSSYTLPKRFVLWNTRTGQEIESWGRFESFYQKELTGRDLKTVSERKTPIVVSLSSTGKYIAQGGSGSVSVHVIKP